MTAARWCDRCKAYKEQPHDHPESPSLFDSVEAEVEKLIEAKCDWCGGPKNDEQGDVTAFPDGRYHGDCRPRYHAFLAGGKVERVDPGPFDLEEGKRQRDQGIRSVKEHEDDDYKARFEVVVRDLTAQGQRFTSEDIIARIGMPPHHPNTVGALTRSMAVKFGYAKVDYIKATRTRRHAGLIAVWGKA